MLDLTDEQSAEVLRKAIPALKGYPIAAVLNRIGVTLTIHELDICLLPDSRTKTKLMPYYADAMKWRDEK